MYKQEPTAKAVDEKANENEKGGGKLNYSLATSF
jgi:hypothetical protein